MCGARAFQSPMGLAERNVDGHLPPGGREVAHLDLDPHAARAGAIRVGRSPQHGQVGQSDQCVGRALRRLGGGRFEFDDGIGGQGGKVGLGPTRALKVAEDHQFPPPFVLVRRRREHLRGALQGRLDVQPLGQGLAAGKLVAERFEVRGRSFEHRAGRRAGKDQVGPQARFILQILIGGQGPRLGNLLRGADRGGHALAHVDQHDPHGVARLAGGGQGLRSEEAAGPRPARASPRPGPAG